MKVRRVALFFICFLTGAAAVEIAGRRDEPATSAVGALPVSIVNLPVPVPRESADLRLSASPVRRTAVLDSGAIDRASQMAAVQSLVPDARRLQRLGELLDEWALEDPESLIRYLADGPANAELSEGITRNAMRLVAEADIAIALTAAERLRQPVADWLLVSAAEVVAARNPELALLLVPDAATGIGEAESAKRDALLEAVARGFARYDLDAAVAWLETLGSEDGAAFNPVIEAVAAVDLGRALELDSWAMTLRLAGDSYGAISWLRSPGMSDLDEPVAIAYRLSETGNVGLLAEIVRRWSVEDPFGVIGWLNVQNAVHSLVVSRAASEVADRSLDEAVAMADSLDPAFQAAWLEAAIESGAAYDVENALSVLENFADLDFYESARAGLLAMAVRQLGPERVAGIAGSAPPVRAAGTIAGAWARSNALAAANWATAIENPAARQSAIASLLDTWSVQDPDAATDWAAIFADPELNEQLQFRICMRTPDCRPSR